MDVWLPVLDALVPPRCGICANASDGGNASDGPLCARCERALRRQPTLGEHRVGGLSAAWSAFEHEGVARRLVVAAKFRARTALLRAGAEQIAMRLPVGLLEAAALVPVPPDPWRARRRGFDAAAEIAGRLAALTNSDVTAPLRRTRAAPQAGKRREERLAAALCVRSTERLPPRITLIDDVVTTGATLRACAEAARAAGAAEVSAITLTRA